MFVDCNSPHCWALTKARRKERTCLKKRTLWLNIHLPQAAAQLGNSWEGKTTTSTYPPVTWEWQDMKQSSVVVNLGTEPWNLLPQMQPSQINFSKGLLIHFGGGICFACRIFQHLLVGLGTFPDWNTRGPLPVNADNMEVNGPMVWFTTKCLLLFLFTWLRIILNHNRPCHQILDKNASCVRSINIYSFYYYFSFMNFQRGNHVSLLQQKQQRVLLQL